MKKENAIEVSDLSKLYTKVGGGSAEASKLWALRDVSFEVKRGDSIGIFGHNGSGKSTLLKILAGVTKPTNGKVSIRGRVASILDIGAGFHPELSGRKNIYLNSSILGFSKKEVSALEQDIVDYSGIGNFIDEPVKNYSSGMYLRLAFGILMHLDFDVYLFDEVFSVGDAQFEAKANKSLQMLSDSDKTVVLVSHQVSALARQAHYLHLNHGKAISFGDNQEVLVEYLTDSIIGTDEKVDVVVADTIVKEFNVKKESPDVLLCEVRIHQPDNLGSQFRTDRAFEIDIVYDKLDEVCTLDLFVSITDLQDNVVLFTSPLVSSEPTSWHKSGRYQTQCTIPGRFFNSRVFVLNVTFLKNVKTNINHAVDQNSVVDETVLQDNGIEVSQTINRVLFFKPIYCFDQSSLDLSKFDINSNLVPAFSWKQHRIEDLANPKDSST